LYLETTVFNYFFDKERKGHADTVHIFEAIGRGEYEAYTSTYVTFELERCHEPKRTNMLALIEKFGITILLTDDEVARMARIYVREGVVPVRYRLDGAHIAIATVHSLDGILSFNLQHINNDKTKELTASVNAREKYRGLFIATPGEVLRNEKPN
jgi:predicted nucleic acid-binding protein